MSHAHLFYIDGRWMDPVAPQMLDVIDPATENAIAQVALGTGRDVDKAVAAAQRAFRSFGQTGVAERRDLLRQIAAVYRSRRRELTETIMGEMGVPRGFAEFAQVDIGLAHLDTMIAVLENFAFAERKGTVRVVREPVGVVGLITPWNWPLNQITCKIAPAIAAGCTMVLKPSERAPLNAVLMAEILHEAGVPKGVFNLVNGDGPTVGQALASHPGVDMISFTGSTRAGILVAKAAAETVKRVHQELGGKSANILLPDVDLQDAVTKGVAGCFLNGGQSCVSPSRMFVPRDRQAEAALIAGAAADAVVVGAPGQPGTTMGPVVGAAQFDKIQRMIQSGLDEGARLVTGGLGRPAGLDRGYYVRPTVFADVTPAMRIAREEIFGPVLAIMPYDSVDEAADEANNTPYGLAAYVQGRDLDQARRIAGLMRTGNVHINYPPWTPTAPFGGYKQSGNGREYGEYGLDDFLEIKGILGYEAA